MYPTLKGLMAKHGFIGRDMANLLDITESMFSQKLTGKYQFKKSEIDKIIDLFNKTYEEIFFTNEVHSNGNKTA